MLAETIAYRNVYIICGYTDMRKSINGLVAMLTQQYQIKPDAESLYLFCGKKADRMKAILWEEDGFLLLYKVLTGYKYEPLQTAMERTLSAIQEEAEADTPVLVEIAPRFGDGKQAEEAVEKAGEKTETQVKIEKAPWHESEKPKDPPPREQGPADVPVEQNMQAPAVPEQTMNHPGMYAESAEQNIKTLVDPEPTQNEPNMDARIAPGDPEAVNQSPTASGAEPTRQEPKEEKEQFQQVNAGSNDHEGSEQQLLMPLNADQDLNQGFPNSMTDQPGTPSVAEKTDDSSFGFHQGEQEQEHGESQLFNFEQTMNHPGLNVQSSPDDPEAANQSPPASGVEPTQQEPKEEKEQFQSFGTSNELRENQEPPQETNLYPMQAMNQDASGGYFPQLELDSLTAMNEMAEQAKDNFATIIQPQESVKENEQSGQFNAASNDAYSQNGSHNPPASQGSDHPFSQQTFSNPPIGGGSINILGN